jgi:tetratricopeptide (TPR) repeat protein
VEARELLERAHAAYDERADAVAAARVAARIAEIDFAEGHPAQAVARLEPALNALEAAGPGPDIAPLAAQLGRFMIFSGDYDRAAPHIERALALAEGFDLPEALANALNNKSVLMQRQRRPHEGRILVEGALAVALEHDLHAAALRAYNNLSVALRFSDAWREQLATVDRGLDLARRIGDRQWEATFLGGSIGILTLLGRWDDALDRAAEASELAAVEFARGLTLQAVLIHAHRGAYEEAHALLTRHSDISSSENPDFVGTYASHEGILLAMEGRTEEALEAAERALRAHPDPRGSPPWARVWAFDAAAGVDDVETIRDVLARVVDDLPPGDFTPSLRGQQARFRARLPEHDSDVEFAAAERIFRDLEGPFYLAATQLEHAERLTADGRAAEAEPLLTEASSAFERLRATPWLERLRHVEVARTSAAV